MARNFIVLVVDDEPLIRIDLVERLELAGCLAIEAGSAADAISILEFRTDVTVVFTDVQMPGTMDGIALASYVRKRWPPTMIVVSSGKGVRPENVLADDIPFLSKPYDDAQLATVLAEIRSRL